LNFTGANPLIGRSERQFSDLSQLYAQDFYTELRTQLAAAQIQLQRGILAWMSGPSYETPAEVNALESLGAAAVSMSTIPEAIIARRYGLEVAAVSLITNLAAGKNRQGLNHEDVLRLGSQSTRAFEQLLKKLFVLWLPSGSV
jgi:purine-nucleoside phosphorylase